jgi:hypothetical protein
VNNHCLCIFKIPLARPIDPCCNEESGFKKGCEGGPLN